MRANELRHRAFSNVLKNSGHRVYEVIESKNYERKTTERSLTDSHFQTRVQVEFDFFSNIALDTGVVNYPSVNCIDINDDEVFKFANKLNADLVITFGCSIVKSKLIQLYRNKILGIHLGLSPYYRGSGTNFFPFVNNELGAIGYTLMNLNEGVDTGDIVHQAYADIYIGDSIHVIGMRLIQKMFSEIVCVSHLDRLRSEFAAAVKQPKDKNFKVYRKQDFNELNLALAVKNLNNDSIKRFLENIEVERSKFPLIREINLDAT